MRRLSIAAVLLAACAAWAGDAYYDVPLTALRFTEAGLPPIEAPPAGTWRLRWDMMRPYAVGSGGEEMYFYSTAASWGWRAAVATWRTEGRLAIRAPEGQPPSGTLFFPRSDLSGMARRPFEVDAAPAPEETGRAEFLRAKLDHYRHLQRLDGPGGAWFRSQADAARAELADLGHAEDAEGARDRFRARRAEGLEATFDLFTGGRAVSENLQLDRELNVLGPGERAVDVDTIEGITVAEIDWQSLIEEADPETDRLAALVPEDQHAVFFPSVQSMLDLMDEAQERGTPVLDLLAPRAERTNVPERYERQFALPLTAFARRIGPHLARSVAVTGSDPFLPTGTDVAVLLETQDARTVMGLVAMQQAAQATLLAPAAERVSGEVEGVAYTGFVSPRREVSTYVASVDNVVVISNSLAQLRRIARTAKGDAPSLASLDEYVFFRDRYRLGDEDETALVVLTDATIRRWCGPRWRIAASRRTRAAAAMAEIKARYLADRAAGRAAEETVVQDVPGLGEVQVGPDGVWSPVYGSPAFLTPIIELEIDKVTPQERDAYAWFRNRYQRQWSQFFDPIAARVSLAPRRLGLDLTVRPLIARTEYRELMRVVGDAAVPDRAGAPHKDTLFQIVVALDPDSPQIREAGSFAGSMVPGLRANPLAWVGGWVGAYVDDDPFWAELAEAGAESEIELERFMRENLSRLPLALTVGVRSPMMAVGFLTAVRAFVEQAAPGMTVWEIAEHGGRNYTRIRPSAMALEGIDDVDRAFGLNYAVFGGMLFLTPSEAAMHRALERHAARAQADVPPEDAPPWPGKSVSVRARRGSLAFLETFARDDISRAFQERALANVFILNEWRRVLGQEDPVAFHAQHWLATLVCPGGGSYVWNEAHQTMESTVFGHPGEPRRPEGLPNPLEGIASVELGLTFEEDGLRARGAVDMAEE